MLPLVACVTRACTYFPRLVSTDQFSPGPFQTTRIVSSHQITLRMGCGASSPIEATATSPPPMKRALPLPPPPKPRELKPPISDEEKSAGNSEQAAVLAGAKISNSCASFSRRKRLAVDVNDEEWEAAMARAAESNQNDAAQFGLLDLSEEAPGLTLDCLRKALTYVPFPCQTTNAVQKQKP